MKFRFLKLFMVSMLLLSCSSTKVKPYSSSNITYESNTRFFATVTTRRPGDVKYDGKTFVRIPNAIPNSSLTYLIFHNKPKLFRADYTIDVRFFQEEKFVFNQLFTGFVEKESYEDTKNNLYYLSTLDVLVDPGKYDIEIRYESDVRKAITKIYNVRVPNYNVFSIASPHLLHYNGKKDKDGKDVDHFVTNYTNFLTNEDLTFLTELYNVKAGNIKFKFDFFKDNTLVQTSYTTTIVTSVDIYTLPIMKVKVEDLKEGEYLLKITVSDDFNNIATTEIRIFKESNILKYSTDKEWKDTTRLLGFIASNREHKILKKLKTPAERKIGVYNFWKNRDHGENLFIAKEHFYKRVQIVNNKWGLNKRFGWKTDQGRIYIKFGEPDLISLNPMNGRYRTFRGKSYEVWTYERLDRIIIFVDNSRTGIGYRVYAIYNRRGENLGLNEDVNHRNIR